MQKFLTIIFICFMSLVSVGQESKKSLFFIAFSNFKPDLGYSTNLSFDIPNNLNIMDVDPTNYPGHSFEVGIKKIMRGKTYLSFSFGYLQAKQFKSFLNYRDHLDLIEFGYSNFYITTNSFKHERLFNNTSIQQYLMYGLFIEAGLKSSYNISSRRKKEDYFLASPELNETYASVLYDAQKQATPFVFFYNLKIGYDYKGFAASFLYEQNFTQMERSFKLRGIEYTEKQPFWKNIGFSLSYTFDKRLLKNQNSQKTKK